MKSCRFCNHTLTDEAAYCPACGYDFKTDTIHPELKEQSSKKTPNKPANRKGSGIAPRVKKFAFAGLSIVVLYLVLGRVNFDAAGITFKIKSIFFDLRKMIPGKNGQGSKSKEKAPEKKELLTVSFFGGVENPQKYKDALVVEGIFFDPNAKSYVTLNGKVLAEGESLSEVLVKKINKDSVELIIAGKSKVLKATEEMALPGFSP